MQLRKLTPLPDVAQYELDDAAGDGVAVLTREHLRHANRAPRREGRGLLTLETPARALGVDPGYLIVKRGR